MIYEEIMFSIAGLSIADVVFQDSQLTRKCGECPERKRRIR